MIKRCWKFLIIDHFAHLRWNTPVADTIGGLGGGGGLSPHIILKDCKNLVPNNTNHTRIIISHVRLFMIISDVKIIAFQLSLFCKNYRFSKTVLYIINRKIHRCLEIPDLFLVLNMISHSFAALTREISGSTLKINLVFPRTATHVLFST
jgi:hypothetical protein